MHLAGAVVVTQDCGDASDVDCKMDITAITGSTFSDNAALGGTGAAVFYYRTHFFITAPMAHNWLTTVGSRAHVTMAA